MLTQREAALLSFRRAHLAFAAMTSDELLSLLSALPGARRLPADPLLIETGALHEVLQRVATCPRLEAVRELVAELDRLDKLASPDLELHDVLTLTVGTQRALATCRWQAPACDLLFRRSERTVRPGLPSGVLPGQVGSRVWPVACCSV